ncbi:uncharacterized protein EI90DRAFT_3014094 [Cantharellus anzutake]|uniref:uncharacterized protein n=1 Tax=Cantharellus anzutake TaxID=1750568 RepID=UPI001904D408|nr:uncharacterized protein EI90DRAFT_3014094 [Cantharellus anzutake]KAF8336296.1 hypothetical protein EI90DRAFT_3014094 [Cantharellus anzutake]
MAIPKALRLHAIVCALASGGLLAFLSVLDFLAFSSFLEHHKFGVEHIKTATQIFSFVSQLVVTALLALLSYGIPAIAVNATIQQCQALLVLHDNVEAWQGLGSSLCAAWQTTPSLFSMKVVTMKWGIPVTVNSMPGNIISPLGSSINEILPFGVVDYLYKQMGYIVVGDLVGVNDIILFGTMDQKLEGVEFEDHTALNLSARCGIIPHASGDSFNFSYYPVPIEDYPDCGTIVFQVYPKFTHLPGTALLYSEPVNIVGLMNRTSSAPPQFGINDTLLVLYPQDNSINQTSTFAIALVTTKDYTLGDGRQGSPVHLTKEVQVYTSVTTANLRSDHKLLEILGKHGYNSQPKFINMPFERKSNPVNQVEKYFGYMLYKAYYIESLYTIHQPPLLLQINDCTFGSHLNFNDPPEPVFEPLRIGGPTQLIFCPLV